MELGFDDTDTMTLRGTRAVIERSSLPYSVMNAFRLWLAVDLFKRGKGRITEHFSMVLNKERVSIDAGDAVIFSTYVTNRFPEFIVSEEGLALVADLVCVRDGQVQAGQVVRTESPIGPALPPHMAERVRQEGWVLSAFEDPDSDLWKVEVRPVEPIVPARGVDSEGVSLSGSEYSDAEEVHPVATHKVVRWAGMPRAYVPDWGDPGEGFFSGAVDAALAGQLKNPVARGRGGTVVKVPDKHHVAKVAVPSSAGVFGVRALLAEVDWGLWPDNRDATLTEVCQFVAGRNRVSSGEIELFAKFKATTKGPYPSRWYIRKRAGTGLYPKDLLGPWRGKDAVVDWGPPPVS